MRILFYFFTLLLCMIIFSCKKEYFHENCLQLNIPPIAKAGKDTTIILPTNSITLNSYGSFDPDGKIISFQWQQVSGTNTSILTNQQKAQATASSLIEGIYLFTLKVTDNAGLKTRDTIIVTVLPAINNKKL